MVARNLFFGFEVFHASSYHPGASGLNALLGHDYTASINASGREEIQTSVGLKKIFVRRISIFMDPPDNFEKPSELVFRFQELEISRSTKGNGKDGRKLEVER